MGSGIFRKLKTVLFAALPFAGAVFLLWYIRSASADVVYSDYIRLVVEYLPDVTDPSRFLVPDILTRTPAMFPERLINTKLFGFSVNFDRVLCVAGLFMTAMAVCVYSLRKNIHFVIYAVIMAVVFSLNKWEILLNGTSWPHLVTFGFFFWNYLLIDIYEEKWRSKGSSGKCGMPGLSLRAALIMMPLVIMLFAGEYIASYAVTMLLFCIFRMITKKTGFGKNGGNTKKDNGASAKLNVCGCGLSAVSETDGHGNVCTASVGIYPAVFATALAALGLYILSRHFAVWEYAGSTDISFMEAVMTMPGFFVRFFVKTFTGTVIGVETISGFNNGNGMPDALVILIGLAVIAAYMLAAALYLCLRLYKKTIFPMLLLLSGFMNHGLITMARWIFLRESYAMSSRYCGQFMIGIIGILLIFGLAVDEIRAAGDRSEDKKVAGKQEADKSNTDNRRSDKSRADNGGTDKERTDGGVLINHVRTASGICARPVWIYAAAAAFSAMILIGNLYTTKDEIAKAPYREANYELMMQMLLHCDDYSEEELCRMLEWHKDPAELYKAIDILRDNELNVFRK